MTLLNVCNYMLCSRPPALFAVDGTVLEQQLIFPLVRGWPLMSSHVRFSLPTKLQTSLVPG